VKDSPPIWIDAEGANTMARKSPSPPVEAEPAAALSIDDPGTLLNPWFEGQLSLFNAGVSQMTQSQQVLFQSWLQLVQACWAPWAPFLERGGEQLA
jgi:hypothetical protein